MVGGCAHGNRFSVSQSAAIPWPLPNGCRLNSKQLVVHLYLRPWPFCTNRLPLSLSRSPFLVFASCSAGSVSNWISKYNFRTSIFEPFLYSLCVCTQSRSLFCVLHVSSVVLLSFSSILSVYLSQLCTPSEPVRCSILLFNFFLITHMYYHHPSSSPLFTALPLYCFPSLLYLPTILLCLTHILLHTLAFIHFS